jgi:high-affinity nickel-transport protein
MTPDPIGSAIALGFILGLQHATDADHLVAVATIVSRERRFAAGALIGALWGVGHAVTLTTAGALLIALDLRLPSRLSGALELVVAALIVTLGVLRLRDALRGAGDAPPEHLLGALDGAGTWARARATVIGAVHGLAGTAAVSLLILSTMPSALGAAIYLGMFALGTWLGMTALTAVLAWPVGLALRLRRAHQLLAFGSGLAAIAFGLYYAWAI